jgi:hypothetical protein
MQQNFRKTTDIKSRLEDVILGQGSARSEMMMRRKGSDTGICRQETRNALEILICEPEGRDYSGDQSG